MLAEHMHANLLETSYLQVNLEHVDSRMTCTRCELHLGDVRD